MHPLLLALLLTLAPVRAQAGPLDRGPCDDVIAEAESAFLYKIGLVLAARGETSAACDVFVQVVERWPDTATGIMARERVALLGETFGNSSCAFAATRGVIATTWGGRKELIASHAILGGLLGSWIVPGAFEDPHPAARVGGGVAGLAVGLGGTWLATEYFSVTTGQAMTITTGEALGAWNGAWIAQVVRMKDHRAETTHIATAVGAVGGGLWGLTAAGMIGPDPGGVALVRSGALWGTWYGYTTTLLFPPDKAAGRYARLGVATDLGALGGLGLAAALGPSGGIRRGRVNVVSAAGVVGALVGGSAALLATEYGTADSPDAAGYLIGGTTAGLVTGVLLTRGTPPPRWGRRSATLPTLGVPVATVAPDEDGGTRVWVGLTGGTF